jgi:uncharacterized membrane protein SpoIIM required for sporulation
MRIVRSNTAKYLCAVQTFVADNAKKIGFTLLAMRESLLGARMILSLFDHNCRIPALLLLGVASFRCSFVPLTLGAPIPRW